jgi:hypothetical protein
MAIQDDCQEIVLLGLGLRPGLFASGLTVAVAKSHFRHGADLDEAGASDNAR